MTEFELGDMRMKNFNRPNLLFSLCGLNCGLCTMHLDGYCPGCGGGKGNQSCKIARCSMEHNHVEYCYQCVEYPCWKYEGTDTYDSFITHRNRVRDFDKARVDGIDLYNEEQKNKIDILEFLLKDYNDGRKKSFFCLAVNLLELEDLRWVLERLQSKSGEDLTLKEKAQMAADLLKEIAVNRNIKLKLNKKPGNTDRNHHG